MTGESHIEAALGGGGSSQQAGTSHIMECLAGGGGGQKVGESHIASCLAVDTVALLALADVAFRADLLSSLWQDAARTMQVTASGQDVRAWDNVGALGAFQGIVEFDASHNGIYQGAGTRNSAFATVAPRIPVTLPETVLTASLNVAAPAGTPVSMFLIGTRATPFGNVFNYQDTNNDGLAMRFLTVASIPRLQWDRNTTALRLAVNQAEPFPFWWTATHDSSQNGATKSSFASLATQGVVAVDISGTSDISLFGDPQGLNEGDVEIAEAYLWINKSTSEAEMDALAGYAINKYSVPA